MWLMASLGRNAMFLAGMALLIMVLLRRAYRHYGRRSKDKQDRFSLTHVPRPAADKRSLSTAPKDVLKWQVEMHETARELKAELDSKMRALQLLIAQARHESDRLEQNLERCELPRSVAGEVPSVKAATATRWMPGSPHCQAEIFALADQGWSIREIAERVDLCIGEVELILSLRGATPG